jgi:hypothetical protein
MDLGGIAVVVGVSLDVDYNALIAQFTVEFCCFFLKLCGH